MSDETIYKAFKALKQDNAQEARYRVKQAEIDFPHAKELANYGGLVLQKHTETHYSLRRAHSWVINLYPGNQRLYADKNRHKAPFLKVSQVEPWRLEDVVKAAIEALKTKA